MIKKILKILFQLLIFNIKIYDFDNLNILSETEKT